MAKPKKDDAWNPLKLVTEYGWARVEIPDDNYFAAAFWASENCGEEFVDYMYMARNQYIFRNHEAAAMFKLMFA